MHEDFNELLCLAASHRPQRFAELVAADPRLGHDGSVLWALGWADNELSEQLLIDAAGAKGAGGQFTRWSALMGLERLASPALPDVLASLINDRAELVRAAAASIAVGYGDARLVPRLHRIATADRTAPGIRADAWYAIEAIKIREGQTEAPMGPYHGRLVPVRRPAVPEPIRVLSVERVLTLDKAEVHSGQSLATVQAGTEEIRVLAPFHGRIVANLMAPHRLAPPFLAWIHVHKLKDRRRPPSTRL